ncbi:long-chain fatty acid--CoA ligase [bacterium]|nr:MAG: long-chain fatty acid--CoA ligase [bacterium]
MLKENLVEYIEQTIKKNWDLPAFTNYKGETVRFGDVAEKMVRMHYIFRQCNVKSGDKIALIGKNSINWAVTYLATVTYGAVAVPGLPDFHSEDLQHIVNHSDAVFLFVADDIFERLDEHKMLQIRAIFSLNDFRILHSKQDNLAQVLEEAESYVQSQLTFEKRPEKFSLERIPNEALASIVYTSGTTGFSKGVMIPHNSLTANVRFALNNLPLHPRENIVSFLPLAHAFGCAFDFLYPFVEGCHIVFISKIPTPQILLEAFKQVRPRLVSSVPLIMEKIYKNRIKPVLNKKSVDFLRKVPLVSNGIDGKIKKQLMEAFGGNFHMVVIGGAALSTEVEGFLMEIGFPFTIGYGMTECGPLISYIPWQKHRRFSVGKVMDTLEIKIDSPDQEKVVGEIMVKGENLMYGYYKNEEDTKAVLTEDGWLRTGDLGLIDKDGYIYIKGRSKTMMLGPSGENIYPEAIESKLNSLPMVGESLVLEKNGKFMAMVYPDMELVDKLKMDERQIEEKMEENRKLLNSLMPAWINIAKVYIHPEEFEKTPTKKVKRFLYTVPD